MVVFLILIYIILIKILFFNLTYKNCLSIDKYLDNLCFISPDKYFELLIVFNSQLKQDIDNNYNNQKIFTSEYHNNKNLIFPVDNILSKSIIINQLNNKYVFNNISTDSSLYRMSRPSNIIINKYINLLNKNIDDVLTSYKNKIFDIKKYNDSETLKITKLHHNSRVFFNLRKFIDIERLFNLNQNFITRFDKKFEEFNNFFNLYIN